MGWWDNGGAISGCVAAYQPVGAASLAASYSNLANPGTYDAAPGTAPSFDTATGWTFNGSTQYLTSGYTPPGTAAFTVIVRYSGATRTGDRCLVGQSDGGQNQGIFVNLSLVGNTAFLANGAYATPATAPAAGVLAVAGGQGFLDGATYGSSWTPAAGTWRPIYIGAYNSAGSVAFRYAGNIQAVAIYSTTLTAGNVATLTTSMEALPVASGSPLPLFAAQLMAMR